MSDVPSVVLNNKVRMPQVGFGVLQVPNDETAATVKTAVAAGYRSIDTATIYGNEAGVGKAIADSDVPRSELFLTTKLWNSDQGYDATMRAFDKSMAELGLEYLDLYLIHWPLPRHDKYVESWRALEMLYADKRVRAIGVSNFQPAHLTRLFDETNIVPAVNQVELHPKLAQEELRRFHRKHGIITEAWSPLAQGTLFSEQLITSLSAKYGKTPAQIVLRWHLQLGNVVIPKSATPRRIAENIALFDFELANDDVLAISELDNGTRLGQDPDLFDMP